jgi:hypothetical protein
MIINPIIAGAGGTPTGVEIYYNTYLPTTDLNLKTFLQTYDVRLHYKHSLLFIYSSKHGATYSSATRNKLYIIPNCYNFTRDYAAIKFTSTNKTDDGWYNLMQQGSKGFDTHSTLSADATTGRLSSTVTSALLCSNGGMVAVWEIPINPTNDATLNIVTDVWGTT